VLVYGIVSLLQHSFFICQYVPDSTRVSAIASHQFSVFVASWLQLRGGEHSYCGPCVFRVVCCGAQVCSLHGIIVLLVLVAGSAAALFIGPYLARLYRCVFCDVASHGCHPTHQTCPLTLVFA
jgi:hypothetical protein